MGWTDDVINWLKDEGIKIAIWLAIAFVAIIVWKIICTLLQKAITASSIKTQETILRSKHALQLKSRSTWSQMKSVGSKTTTPVTPPPATSAAARGAVTANMAGNEEEKDGSSQLLQDINLNEQDIINSELANIELSDDMKERMSLRSKTIMDVIYSIGKLIIILILLISIMDIVGIPTDSLLTGAALIGIGIAFAVQTVVGDYISGVFILAENLYFEGETVTIDDITGTVESLQLRLTILRGEDGQRHTIPNGEIRTVCNESRDFAIAQVTLTMPYKDDENYLQAKGVLEDLIPQKIKEDIEFDSKYILENPSVASVRAIDGSTIKVSYRAKVRPDNIGDVREILINYIRTEFPKAGIEINQVA